MAVGDWLSLQWETGYHDSRRLVIMIVGDWLT